MQVYQELPRDDQHLIGAWRHQQAMQALTTSLL